MRISKFTLLAIFLCIFSLAISKCARAGDYAFHFGGWSIHEKNYLKYRNGKRIYNINEDHNFIGLQYNKWLIASYENSFYKRSYLVGYEFYSKEIFKNITANVKVGFISGYPDCKTWMDKRTDFCPMMAPEITYTKFKLQPSITFMGNSLALTFKYKFKG